MARLDGSTLAAPCSTMNHNPFLRAMRGRCRLVPAAPVFFLGAAGLALMLGVGCVPITATPVAVPSAGRALIEATVSATRVPPGTPILAAVPVLPAAAILSPEPTLWPTSTQLPAPTPGSVSTLPPTPAGFPCRPAITPQPTRVPGPNAPVAAWMPSPGATPRLPAPSGAGQLLDTQFYSPLLGRTMPVLVYLPPGYAESQRRYPVLYMLSGFAGDHHEWVNMGLCDAMETLIRGGTIQPFIVVMPAGDHSWWFNHAPGPGSDGLPFGDYVWKDVVDYADATYRTLRQPASRAVGGLSAGGQAAFMLALTHPEIFGIAGGHSPSTRHADGSLAVFGSQEYFKQYDPLWLFAETPAAHTLKLWIDVAAEDTQWGNAVHDLHTRLMALGISHEFYDSWHGIHDGYYWSAHVGDYMIWYASQLAGAP